MPIIKALISIPVINKYINIFVDSGLFYLNNLVQNLNNKNKYIIFIIELLHILLDIINYFCSRKNTDLLVLYMDIFI